MADPINFDPYLDWVDVVDPNNIPEGARVVSAADLLRYENLGQAVTARLNDTAAMASDLAPGIAADPALTDAYASANPTLVVTYNPDGSVASTTENGVLTTFTYNSNGTVNTQTRAGITKTFSYDTNGNVTGAA